MSQGEGDIEGGGRVNGTLRKGAGGRGKANDGDVAGDNEKGDIFISMWHIQFQV